MRPGSRVRRVFGQGRSGWAATPDHRETRGNAGSVRVVSVDRVLLGKSPAFLDRTEIASDRRVANCHQLSFYTDHPDQDKENKGLAGQSAPSCPDQTASHPDQPPWDDDREWISRWQKAGPTLAEREPVVRAWIASTPPGPLPRGLPATELARIARNHGIELEVERRELAVSDPDARGRG